MPRRTDRLTPVQAKMLEVLSDGLPHHPRELMACLNDDLATSLSVCTHVSGLRRYLAPLGQTVVCEYARRQRLYRHVVLLRGPSPA